MNPEESRQDGFIVSQWEKAPGSVRVTAWYGQTRLTCYGGFDI